MLEGHEWKIDLLDHMAQHLDPQRLNAWGPPALGVNLYRSVIAQITISQGDAPTLTSTETLSDEQQSYLGDLPLWDQHLQKTIYLAGLSEVLVRVTWSKGNQAGGKGIYLDVVTPERICVVDSPDAPGRPLRIEWATKRINPASKVVEWTWDVWSIEDVAAPYFHVESVEVDPRTGTRKNVTAIYAPDMVGKWEWLNDDGTPYLPWVLYHSRDNGRLWSWHEWAELVCASLDLALLSSFWIHIVKDASWAQKFGIGVRLRGTGNPPKGKEGASRISTDPSSLLMFEASSAAGAGQVGVLEPSADPKSVIEAIRDYLTMVAMNMGLGASDLEKTQAESGVAIQLRYDAIRRLQRVYLAGLRRGDLDLVSLVAKVSNQFGEGVPQLPLDGWQITYPQLPLTKEEQGDRLEVRKEEMQLGLVNEVDLYLERHPELTREEAIEKLRMVKSERDQIATTAAAQSLNGAQVQAAAAVVAEVAYARLPRESGVAMLISFFGLTSDQAEQIMGKVGKGFAPSTLEIPK